MIGPIQRKDIWKIQVSMVCYICFNIQYALIDALSECAFLVAHATTREAPAHLTLINLARRHSVTDLHDLTDEVTSQNGTRWREAYEMLMVREFHDEKGAISESNECRVTLELS